MVQTVDGEGNLFITLTFPVSSVTVEAHPEYDCYTTHTTHSHA